MPEDESSVAIKLEHEPDAAVTVGIKIERSLSLSQGSVRPTGLGLGLLVSPGGLKRNLSRIIKEEEDIMKNLH